jgi:ethanolamine ammonia-lyase large subunit
MTTLMFGRRIFLGTIVTGIAATQLPGCTPPEADGAGVLIDEIRAGEDVFAYVERIHGSFDIDLFRQVIGAANEFKEGDEALGVAAADAMSRQNARTLLANTKLGELQAQPLFEDQLYGAILDNLDDTASAEARAWTMDEFKAFLLSASEDEIKAICPGLGSDVIACVVKLMSNDELIAVGAKVFNPLPGTKIGAKGYMGARIQPNSPTDDLDDIRWQVFNGWAFAVGDVVLGTNPVSSDPVAVAGVEAALQEIREVFGLTDVIPTACSPTSTSRPPSREAARHHRPVVPEPRRQRRRQQTFGISRSNKHARPRGPRPVKWGLYFETGQGADFTNGHGKGVDMVVQESRKYGFARVLTAAVAAAQQAGGEARAVGPRQRRRRLHRPRGVSLPRPAGPLLPRGHRDGQAARHHDRPRHLQHPAHGGRPRRPRLVHRPDHARQPRLPDGLPTKNDPMLSYLTTAFQDHVRVREKFGYKVNDAMWTFFRDTLEVIDVAGQPTEHFGEPRGCT